MDKKDFSEIIFYQQFKKIVYFCKLKFDDKCQKIDEKKEQNNIAETWKEHSNLRWEKEQTSTVSARECLPPMVEKCWPPAAAKAERDWPSPTSAKM